MSGNLVSILGGKWSPPAPKEYDAPEIQLANAIREAGFEPPQNIQLDGKLHRFWTGGNRKKKTGWCIAWDGSFPAGSFGDWKENLTVTWRADVGRDITDADRIVISRRMAEARSIRDAEQKLVHETVADVAETIWESCLPASADHPYLISKNVKPNGARVTSDGRIVIPMIDANGDIISLQYIDHEGNKLYANGGKVIGARMLIGQDDGDTIYIAEGFATASSIHEATGCPTYVAFSKGGLMPVAADIRSKYGLIQDIVIVADNDESGDGEKSARAACEAHGCRFIMPPMIGDANDYATHGHDLVTLLTPVTGSAIFDKLKAVFGNDLPTDYEAPDELVEGMMTTKSLTVVYGDSNSGKTFWALSVAASIASNQPCYGRQVDPGLVVYLATEAPGSIRSRMQAIKRFYGCDLADLVMVPVPINFHTSDDDTFDVIELVRAVEGMKGKPCRLIIGDTLARMSAGANENSGEDMGPVMARFDQVAQVTGAALMIIHHTGKDAAKGARGWSGIRAHIDTEIEVLEADGVRTATVMKQRELPGKGEAIHFRLEIIEMGTTKFGLPATTCVAVLDDNPSPKAQPSVPKNIKEGMLIFEKAWWSSGAEMHEGSPYVSRSGLVMHLEKSGAEKRKIGNMIDPNKSSGIILPLIEGDIIEANSHGWTVCNGTFSSALMLARKIT